MNVNKLESVAVFSGLKPVLCLSLDSLQQRRAHNRVWMLYRIRNGRVTIPPVHLKLTAVATRRQLALVLEEDAR